MITKTARHTAFATGAVAVAAATAVLVSALSGGAAAAGAMPRVRMLHPTTAVVSNNHTDAGQATGSNKSKSSVELITLAPYTNSLGAVVTPTSSMEAFLTASIYDVASTWTRLFQSWNYTGPTAFFQFPEPGVVLSSCGETDDSTFAYCPGDDTITINQEAARQLWLGHRGDLTNAGLGDMSIALFVAHEYGHNIEAELDRLNNVTAAQAERGADCFAGVWAQDAAARGILEAGDLNEALSGLDLVAEHPGMTDGIHGTPEERQGAFRVGYEQNARACVTTYLS
jgi:predicted metalloprotease